MISSQKCANLLKVIVNIERTNNRMKIEEAFELLEKHNNLASKITTKPIPPEKPKVVKRVVEKRQPIFEELADDPSEENGIVARSYYLTPLIAVFGIVFIILGIALTGLMPTPLLKTVGGVIALILGIVAALIDFRKVTKHNANHIFYEAMEYIGFRDSQEDLNAYDNAYEDAAETANKNETHNIEMVIEEIEEADPVDPVYRQAVIQYENELASYNNLQRKVALSLKNIEDAIQVVNERAKSWKIDIDYRTKMVKKVNLERGSVVFDYESDPNEDIHFYANKRPGKHSTAAVESVNLDYDTQPIRQLKAS